MEESQKAVVFNAKDNVPTALMNLEAGTTLRLEVGDQSLTVRLTGVVPFGNKFSLTEIEPGSPLVKYGEIIGIATSGIHPGDYVHIHNVASNPGRSDCSGGSK